MRKGGKGNVVILLALRIEDGWPTLMLKHINHMISVCNLHVYYQNLVSEKRGMEL